MRHRIERRDFIKQSAMAGIGAGLTTLHFPLYGLNAPNEKVVLAIMGVNGRGSALASTLCQLPGVAIAYICDVDEKPLAKGIQLVEKRTGKAPRGLKDFRKALEDKSLDGLVIAAPDHWHAPAAILACAAGKHVYVEKPCSHNPQEGEWLVQAAHRYQRVVQMGNQRRSFPHLMAAMKELHEGIIGNVYFAKGWYTNNRTSIGRGKKVPVPANLDFELWQGPAPREDYRDNIVHYNWHWFWNWGTGETCNNGTHEIDCMRWALGVNFPNRVVAAGGRYAYQDDWQTPDTQVVTFEFPENKAITWESRSCNSFPVEKTGRGFIVYGEKGSLVNLGGNDYKFFDTQNKLIKESAAEEKTDTINRLGPGEKLDAYHLGNFVDCIRSGQQPHSRIDEGHKSVLLCHLGNISHRVGRALHCDPTAGGKILHDPEAMTLWSRKYQPGWEPKV